ncbi:MAG: HIT family protein, partial [Candidatus Fonsibacter sp.]
MFKIHKDFKKTSIFIANLNLSELRLMNNQFFPWFILIPKRKVKEIDELEKIDQIYLLDEINLI